MKNCKRLINKLFVLLFLIGMVSPAHTTGIPVIDGSNIYQTTISAAENVTAVLQQAEQYRTQLEQFEDQILHSAAPAAYIWSKAQYTMNKLAQVSNTLKFYQTQGGVQSYLNRYRNASYYSNSPCFKLDLKCSSAQWQLMREGQAKSTDAQKSANDAALRGLEVHQLEAQPNAAQLQQLQANAQTAKGQLQAIQYASQLAAFQSNQLMQLNNMMIAKHNAEITREQARIDKEAMQQAAHEAFTKRLSPENLPASRKWNVRDGF